MFADPRSKLEEVCKSKTKKKEVAAYSKLCRRQIAHRPGNHGTGGCSSRSGFNKDSYSSEAFTSC
jgi:hypothetical protein